MKPLWVYITGGKDVNFTRIRLGSVSKNPSQHLAKTTFLII